MSFTPNAMIYTYYKGRTRLITASTREMENLEQFDQLVVDKLEGRQPAAGFAAAELEAPDELYSWKFGDDVECQVADLVGYQGSVLYCTKLVIAPQKNLVLTFCGQVHKDYAQGALGVQYALNRLCDKLTFFL